MRKTSRTVAMVCALAAATYTASTLYADSGRDKRAPTTDESGTMSRMGEMRGMMGMMEGCARMMGTRGGGSERPNDQWRKPR
jgi:hypothetical protein